MSDTSTEHEPEERKLKMEEFYFQRKMLFGCTISLIIGTILWIIAMTENRWFIVNGDKGEWKNFSQLAANENEVFVQINPSSDVKANE